MVTFKTKAPKAENREIEVEYNFGETPEQTLELFGAEAVCAAATAQFKIDLQAIIRSKMEDGKTDNEIKALVEGWKPGMKVAREPKAPKEITNDAVLNFFANMTPEAQIQLITALKEKRAGATA